MGGPLPDHSKEIHYGKFPLAGAQIYTHTINWLRRLVQNTSTHGRTVAGLLPMLGKTKISRNWIEMGIFKKGTYACRLLLYPLLLLCRYPSVAGQYPQRPLVAADWFTVCVWVYVSSDQSLWICRARHEVRANPCPWGKCVSIYSVYLALIHHHNLQYLSLIFLHPPTLLARLHLLPRLNIGNVRMRRVPSEEMKRHNSSRLFNSCLAALMVFESGLAMGWETKYPSWWTSWLMGGRTVNT